MAEIDLLKVWDSGKKASRLSEVTVDLEQATKGRSRNTLRWISIILWIELGLNVIFTPLIYVWWKEAGLTWQFSVFLGIVIAYLAYYIFLIRAIQQFDYAIDVRRGLRKIYGYLHFYLLHYKVVIWVIFPLSFVYGLYLGLAEEGFPDMTLRKILILAGISVLLNAAFSSLLNWLINLIYGRKIKRLKGMVAELEAVE